MNDNLICGELSDFDVCWFARLYEKEFDEKITFDEASEMARNMITFYRILLRPLPKPPKDDPPCICAGSNP